MLTNDDFWWLMKEETFIRLGLWEDRFHKCECVEKKAGAKWSWNEPRRGKCGLVELGARRSHQAQALVQSSCSDHALRRCLLEDGRCSQRWGGTTSQGGTPTKFVPWECAQWRRMKLKCECMKMVKWDGWMWGEKPEGRSWFTRHEVGQRKLENFLSAGYKWIQNYHVSTLSLTL